MNVTPLFLIILALTAHNVHAQVASRQPRPLNRVLLMLQKKNSNKNAYYSIGDQLSFRLKGEKWKRSGEIVDLNDSSIVFRGYEVELSEIKAIYVDEKTKWWLRYKISQLTLLMGATYFLVDVANTGELSQQTAVVSTAFLAVGLASRALIGDKIKIRGKTRLRILRL